MGFSSVFLFADCFNLLRYALETWIHQMQKMPRIVPLRINELPVKCTSIAEVTHQSPSSRVVRFGPVSQADAELAMVPRLRKDDVVDPPGQAYGVLCGYWRRHRSWNLEIPCSLPPSAGSPAILRGTHLPVESAAWCRKSTTQTGTHSKP